MNLLATTVLALLTVSGCADDTKGALDSLQGEWKYLSFTKLGRDNPDVVKNGKVVIKGDEVTFSFDGEDTTTSFTLDPKADPPTIDMKAGKKLIRGIYKLEKAKLTICFGIENSRRPTEFKSGGDDSIMVLERVKK